MTRLRQAHETVHGVNNPGAWDGWRVELASAWDAVWFRPGNSNMEKIVLLTLCLAFLIFVVSAAVGRLDLANPGTLAAWTIVSAAMGGMFTRIQEREKIRRRTGRHDDA